MSLSSLRKRLEEQGQKSFLLQRCPLKHIPLTVYSTNTHEVLLWFCHNLNSSVHTHLMHMDTLPPDAM